MKNVDKISRILLDKSEINTENGDIFIDKERDCAAEKILRLFYPKTDNVYFVSDKKTFVNDVKNNNFRNYYQIESLLICQTEEIFLNLDNIKLKTKISEIFENAQTKIHLITNSILDYTESKNFLSTSYRPGILDLICYNDFLADPILNFSNIKFHSSFVYQNFNPARDEVALFIKENKHQGKFSYLKYSPKNIREENVDLNYNSNYIDSENGSFPSVPYLQKVDKEWTNYIGFFTEVESFNETNYAPTLSEKTFRAMHLMRPALIFGGLNTRRRLQDLGFDTWDWLIDWSFDTELDWCLRSDLFLKELHRLLNLDLNYIKQLLHKNEDKLMYNRNRVLELIENYADDSYFSKAID